MNFENKNNLILLLKLLVMRLILIQISGSVAGVFQKKKKKFNLLKAVFTYMTLITSYLLAITFRLLNGLSGEHAIDRRLIWLITLIT